MQFKWCNPTLLRFISEHNDHHQPIKSPFSIWLEFFRKWSFIQCKKYVFKLQLMTLVFKEKLHFPIAVFHSNNTFHKILPNAQLPMKITDIFKQLTQMDTNSKQYSCQFRIMVHLNWPVLKYSVANWIGTKNIAK